MSRENLGRDVLFSVRLQEERRRLGLNQTKFGGLAGVSQRSQTDYETGKIFPDAQYLAAIAAAGADVTYILTGVRAIPSDAQPLTKQEAFVLETYRMTDEAGKAALRTTLSAFAQSKRVREEGKKAG
jgi:transcriptional regulator with XRE-family HTH domain